MMFALFDGEKYFDVHGVSSSAEKNIICDVKADFSLKKLDNYTLLDAVKTLNCAKQNAESGKIVRMIYPKEKGEFYGGFFHRNCYYLQEILIHDFSNLYNRLSGHNVYILEDLVAALCADKTPKNQGWLYVAKHCRWRIICGIGKGVVVSRSLSENIDINQEVDRTLVYLKRFGLAEEFCVFNQEKIQGNHVDIGIPIESFLVDMAKKTPISPVYRKQKSVSTVTMFFGCLGAVALIIGVVLHVLNIHHSVVHTNLSLKNSSVEIIFNEDNVDEVKNFIEVNRNEFLPWNDFYMIRRKYPYMTINKISLNNNEIRIYTPDSVDIKASKNVSVNHENEETVVCIKK